MSAFIADIHFNRHNKQLTNQPFVLKTMTKTVDPDILNQLKFHCWQDEVVHVNGYPAMDYSCKDEIIPDHLYRRFVFYFHNPEGGTIIFYSQLFSFLEREEYFEYLNKALKIRYKQDEMAAFIKEATAKDK